MWISKKKLNAMLNKAYLEGLEFGKNQGRVEGLLSSATPNGIRKVLGLKPIVKGENNDIPCCTNDR